MQAVSDRGAFFLEVEILEGTRQGTRKKEWQEEGPGTEETPVKIKHGQDEALQDENEAKDEKGKRKAADAEHMEKEKTVNTPTAVKRENREEW